VLALQFSRCDRRSPGNQTGKRQSVIAARERNGKTVTFVAKTEDQGVAGLKDRIEVGSTVLCGRSLALGSIGSAV
jgi:hypothetical protein